MRQPSGSKIEVLTGETGLELKIPARFRPDQAGWHQIGLTAILLVFSLLLIGLVFFILIKLSGSGEDIAVKFALSAALLFIFPPLFFAGRASSRLLFELLERFSSHLALSLDRHRLTMVTRLLSVDRSRPQTIQTRDIFQISIDRYRHPTHKTKEAILILSLSDNRSVKLLSSGPNLTAKEVEWVGYKLCKYLGIEIFNNDEIQI
jgi:hypothetical protein